MCLRWPTPLRHIILLFSFLYVANAGLSHYITAPNDIVPGVNTTLAVHLLGANYSKIKVNAEIRDRGEKVLAGASGIFYNNTIGLLTIPAVPLNSSSSLYYLSATGLAQNNVIFTNQIALNGRTRNSNIFTFIQTDKVAYKPGQTLKIRVISVGRDLKPHNGLVNLTIKNPENAIVKQWKNLSTDIGVVSTEFLLSDNPMFGSWSIKSIVNNAESIVYFTVTNVVLPKFEVSIQMPSFYVEPMRQNLTGTVTAKNIFGKKINGKVVISLKPLYYYSVSNYINKTYTISGSANFSFTYEEMLHFLNLDGINLTASVTEELTGIEATAYSFIERTDSEYKIIILQEPRDMKPGLNFTAKMQILKLNNESLTEEERNSILTVKIIQSTTSYWWSNSISGDLPENITSTTPVSNPATIIVREYTIPEYEFINIQFPIIQSLQLLRIEAQYRNTTQTWILDKSTTSTYYANIRMSNSVKKVGQAFEIDVETKPRTQELYYIVMAMGRIVKAGQTSNTTFILTPEYSWAPQANLIVYFPLMHEQYGDIIQTSATFFVQGLFLNKVSLSWSKHLASPSENVSLTVNVPKSRSLVGLDVTERRSTHDETNNFFTASRVENEFSMYNQGLGSTMSNFVVSYSNNPFDELFPMYRGEGEFKFLPVPNSIFIPETWLCLETNISSGITNSLQATTPKTNSTWFASAFVISEELGLGFTEEAIELEVFQPFFILLNQPYSVVRGEQFIAEVSLFNYLEEDQEVTITIERSESFEIIAPNNDTSIIPGKMNVTILSQDTKVVLFPIRPKKLGQISITVTAISSTVSYTATQITFVKIEGVKRFVSQAAVFEVLGPQSVLKTFSFTFPVDVVRDSEEAFITLVGDLLAPSIDGLEALILMPYGCGEQTMVNFAPNIYILHYLIATHKSNENIRKKAIQFMELGYQNELNYRRKEGSFSAFGNSDASGSTWLTAFVFRCFLQARPFIFISQEVLDQMAQWLVQYQDISTGIFSEPGRVIHSELQGGLNGPLTLTAYILTCLVEDESYRNRYEFTVEKAVQYLESQFDAGISSNYTLSVVTYALSLANSTKAEAALTQLNSRAIRTGDLKYWPSPSATINYWQPRTNDIETAAYALLSYYTQNRISDGIPVMKWLSQQRNHLGGYTSTQDTVMALQALARFLSVMPNGNTSLNVTVTGTGSLVPKTFHINNENLFELQSQQITVSQPLSLNVSASGRGIAILQLNINYNQKESSRHRRETPLPEAFTLDITVNEDKSNIRRFSVDVCTSYTDTGNESGMALLDVGILSGFTADAENIPITGSLKKIETKEDRVYLYFDSINKTPVCVSVPMVRVANVAGSQDAVITILDYYNPSKAATRMYNSETMKSISLCDYCGFNCTLCLPNRSQTTLQENSTTSLPVNYTTTLPVNYTTTLPVNYTTTLPVNYTTSLPVKSTTSVPVNSTTSVPINSTTVQRSLQTTVKDKLSTTMQKSTQSTAQRNSQTTLSTSAPAFHLCGIFLLSLYFILWSSC